MVQVVVTKFSMIFKFEQKNKKTNQSHQNNFINMSFKTIVSKR
jgi:hypothetical protein